MFVKDQKEEILMATDYGMDVYRRFIAPDIKLGKNVLSPLRQEKMPSFSIYVHRRRGDVWYKDFREGGQEFHGDAFHFVQSLYRLNSLSDSIKVIKEQVLGIYNDNPTQLKAVLRQSYKPKKIAKDPVQLIPEYRSLTYHDEKLWGRFLIAPRELKKFHVEPASSVTKIKEGKETLIKEWGNDPIYIIRFPSGRMKVYRPLTKNRQFKWLSNVLADKDIFGLDSLPEYSRDLFIMAGNKDTMSFNATTGIPTIAMNSESVAIPAEILLYLESKAENIHLFYDNDEAGHKGAMKISASTGFKSHGALLEKYSLRNYPMNDYSQLVDEQRQNLPDFFARLKRNMGNKSKTLSKNI